MAAGLIASRELGAFHHVGYGIDFIFFVFVLFFVLVEALTSYSRLGSCTCILNVLETALFFKSLYRLDTFYIPNYKSIQRDMARDLKGGHKRSAFVYPWYAKQDNR